MHVAVAHAAGRDADQDLARAWNGRRHLADGQRFGELLKKRSFHKVRAVPDGAAESDPRVQDAGGSRSRLLQT
jgi:hypothetical protein